MSATQRITAKQTAFADFVAAGSNLTESYRKAYGAGRMKPATIHAHACRLATNAKVVTRIKAQEVIKAEENTYLALSTKTKVLNKLEELMHKDQPRNIQLGAAIALGKSVALFTDVTEDKTKARSLHDIDKEIAARLKELEEQARAIAQR